MTKLEETQWKIVIGKKMLITDFGNKVITTIYGNNSYVKESYYGLKNIFGLKKVVYNYG